MIDAKYSEVDGLLWAYRVAALAVLVLVVVAVCEPRPLVGLLILVAAIVRWVLARRYLSTRQQVLP